MTLALNSSADPMQADEVRMRRALGLSGDQPRPRAAPERSDPPPRQPDRFAGPGHKRRFVHDGEVPVTLVHGLVSSRREHHDGNGNGHPTNRLEVAEAALAAEIAARQLTERALQEAQATIRDLQTKLGHADLARQEAAEALRREREASAELRAALEQAEERAAAAEQAHAAAERALLEQREPSAAPAASIEETPRRRRGRKPRAQTAAPVEATPVAATPRKRGRPKQSAPVREPKPIRWWLTPRKKNKR